jgi:hypothetical protein
MLVALAQQTFGGRRNMFAGRIYFLSAAEGATPTMWLGCRQAVSGLCPLSLHY